LAESCWCHSRQATTPAQIDTQRWRPTAFCRSFGPFEGDPAAPRSDANTSSSWPIRHPGVADGRNRDSQLVRAAQSVHQMFSVANNQFLK